MAEIEGTPPPTLRDTIEAAVEEHSEPVETVTPEPATVEPKPDDRPRGPDGKFVAKEADATPKAEAVPPAEAAPVVQRPKPPSSWKKEYHADWDALATGKPLSPERALALLNYNLEREGQYASGVSTYKTEYERIKPFADAVAPFLPTLQQHNIEPGQWISRLGQAHELLVTGRPEQKLGMFLKLARDYQVPVEQLFAQGNDGKVYYNPQVQAYQMPAPQVDVSGLVQQEIAKVFSQQQIQNFGTEKDASGNPAHPHYDTVRETMAQLLEAGLADDLASAYQTALSHPRHAGLAVADRQQREAADKAEQARKAAEQAQRARRSAVSPRTATPAGKTAGDKKGLRSALEDAFDQHAEGRV